MPQLTKASQFAGTSRIKYRFIMHFRTLLVEEHSKKKWLCIQSLFCNPHCICLFFVEKPVLGDGSRKSDQSPPWDFILLAYYLIPCGINVIFSWGRSSPGCLVFFLFRLIRCSLLWILTTSSVLAGFQICSLSIRIPCNLASISFFFWWDKLR